MKKITVFLVVLGLCSVFIGCSGNNDESEASQQEEPKAETSSKDRVDTAVLDDLILYLNSLDANGDIVAEAHIEAYEESADEAIKDASSTQSDIDWLADYIEEKIIEEELYKYETSQTETVSTSRKPAGSNESSTSSGGLAEYAQIPGVNEYIYNRQVLINSSYQAWLDGDTVEARTQSQKLIDVCTTFIEVKNIPSDFAEYHNKEIKAATELIAYANAVIDEDVDLAVSSLNSATELIGEATELAAQLK